MQEARFIFDAISCVLRFVRSTEAALWQLGPRFIGMVVREVQAVEQGVLCFHIVGTSSGFRH
jgi:hypothetical protein